MLEILLRIALWTGLGLFTWSVSDSLEKIAASLSQSKTTSDG